MADDITADVLTYDGKAKVVTAKGNVVIHANEGATITAADGEYHFEERECFPGRRRSLCQESGNIDDKLFLYNDKTARGIEAFIIMTTLKTGPSRATMSCTIPIQALPRSKETATSNLRMEALPLLISKAT